MHIIENEEIDKKKMNSEMLKKLNSVEVKGSHGKTKKDISNEIDDRLFVCIF